ncbi:3462_t:CDS:2 [Ambispora gerdemannii]|uniref:3462_t:CDS:1 n=1 Tax=Ambispora gerdemannii TaxID=144530 RepID=A0A9N8V5H3_9GLOM|nr:3462_t:CDS:2 [Ambispora gerdemannii]
MNKDPGVPATPRSPKIQRTSSTQRKPRVTSAAKLDLTQTKPQITRSNTLPPPPGKLFVKNTRNNTVNVLPDNKEKSRSDDGFHSDSDKDSNNSNISVHSSISHLNRKSNLLKLEPIVRVRSSSSLNNLSETAKIDSFKLANLTTNRQSQSGQQAGEARKERKIQDLEISIQSLIKLNTELDATNKQQAAEIQRLKQRLEMHENYISGLNATDDENEDDNEVSTPLSDVEFLERERENDIRFRRILIVIDEMIRTGKAAIESIPKLNGSRVLSSPQIGLNRAQRASSSSRGKSTDTINMDTINAEELFTKVELVPDDKLIKLKKSEAQSEQKGNNNHHLKRDNIILNADGLQSSPDDTRTYLKETEDTYSSKNELKSNLSLKNPETKIKISESIDEALEINKDRVRAVIDELLILAKQDHFYNKTPATSPVKERPGLGILLQRGQSTHISSGVNNNEIDDTKQSSSAISLLHELQNLLGLNSVVESSKRVKYNRNSFPVMSSSLNLHVDPPDDIEELHDSSQKTTTRNRRRSSKERIIRRRSSPSFSTPSSSNTVSESHTNNYINLNQIPGLARHTSWVSSLGFLTPWKAATTAAE